MTNHIATTLLYKDIRRIKDKNLFLENDLKVESDLVWYLKVIPPPKSRYRSQRYNITINFSRRHPFEAPRILIPTVGNHENYLYPPELDANGELRVPGLTPDDWLASMDAISSINRIIDFFATEGDPDDKHSHGILSLADDNLYEICHFLLVCDVVQLSACCKTLFKVTNADSLWRYYLCHQLKPTITTVDMIGNMEMKRYISNANTSKHDRGEWIGVRNTYQRLLQVQRFVNPHTYIQAAISDVFTLFPVVHADKHFVQQLFNASGLLIFKIFGMYDRRAMAHLTERYLRALRIVKWYCYPCGSGDSRYCHISECVNKLFQTSSVVQLPVQLCNKSEISEIKVEIPLNPTTVGLLYSLSRRSLHGSAVDGLIHKYANSVRNQVAYQLHFLLAPHLVDISKYVSNGLHLNIEEMQRKLATLRSHHNHHDNHHHHQNHHHHPQNHHHHHHHHHHQHDLGNLMLIAGELSMLPLSFSIDPPSMNDLLIYALEIRNLYTNSDLPSFSQPFDYKVSNNEWLTACSVRNSSIINLWYRKDEGGKTVSVEDPYSKLGTNILKVKNRLEYGDNMHDLSNLTSEYFTTDGEVKFPCEQMKQCSSSIPFTLRFLGYESQWDITTHLDDKVARRFHTKCRLPLTTSSEFVMKFISDLQGRGLYYTMLDSEYSEIAVLEEDTGTGSIGVDEKSPTVHDSRSRYSFNVRIRSYVCAHKPGAGIIEYHLGKYRKSEISDVEGGVGVSVSLNSILLDYCNQNDISLSTIPHCVLMNNDAASLEAGFQEVRRALMQSRYNEIPKRRSIFTTTLDDSLCSDLDDHHHNHPNLMGHQGDDEGVDYLAMMGHIGDSIRNHITPNVFKVLMYDSNQSIFDFGIDFSDASEVVTLDLLPSLNLQAPIC